jgi:hypothetical protein
MATKQISTLVANIAKNTEVSQDNKRDVIKSIYNTTSSDQEIDRWIDTQVFISKYVEEKNFVDIVERNAAYMNLGKTKSVGELYGA